MNEAGPGWIDTALGDFGRVPAWERKTPNHGVILLPNNRGWLTGGPGSLNSCSGIEIKGNLIRRVLRQIKAL
jgi:hypothetical protein